MSEPGKKALLLGYGLGGRAAGRLLLRHGWRVSALDERWREGDLAHGAGDGVRLLDASSAGIPWRDVDLCVASPGLRAAHPWLVEARESGVGLISEFELGLRHYAGRVIAVSGSNGKSTFVKWCAEALGELGLSALPCGNYGVPVSEVALMERPPAYLLLELSSFQLEQAAAVRADAAVLLNVLPNHLDRHGSMERYRAIKFRLFSGLAENAPAIVPEELMEEARAVNPHARWRGFNRQLEGGGEPRRDTPARPLPPGAGAAARALFEECDFDPGVLPGAWERMTPLPHRQQSLCRIGGVRFVNDSKATNLAAMAMAVAAQDGPVRLIAGGESKETDFNSVKEVLAERVECVYLVGRDAGRMAHAWQGTVPCRMCGALERAVRAAWSDSAPGDVVLLSPACTSYDQFRDYQERGTRFADMVNELKREEEHEKEI